MNMKPLRKTLTAVVAGLVFGAGSALAQDQNWTHDPAAIPDPDNTESPLGPYFWGDIESFETCSGGRQQSPVAIDSRTAAAKGQPALVFQYRNTPLVVENTGHVVEVPYDQSSQLRIGGDTYRLVQFHFHAPSEHTLNGKQFAMEAHLVHINASSQLAVVGVLLDEAPAGNTLIDDVFAAAPEEEGEFEMQELQLNALDLLPGRGRAVTHYFTYVGSLTTPPCSEGVRWFVLAEPVRVSHEAVDRLHEIISEFPHYDGFPDNNRPVQPLNGRQILQHGR